jgi:hypothetical protein
MTSDDPSRDAIAQLVFEARPSAPPGLDARVLAIARARSRRRIAAMAAAGAVLASAFVVIVLLPAPPERAAPPAVVPELAKPSPPAPADAAPPPPGWHNVPMLLEQLAAPHRAELRACFAGAGDHRFTFSVRRRSPKDPASDPRDLIVRVSGHRVWNAEDACLDRIVAAMPFPMLPYELRYVNVELAVPPGAQPLVVAPSGDTWADPVAATRTLMRTDFQKKPARVPFTAESCFDPNTVAYVDVELAHGARPRYVREEPPAPRTKFDTCIEFAIARFVTPDLPPSLRDLVVRFQPQSPPPGRLWLDSPPWPDGDRLVLTWRISVPPGAPEPAFGVELTATIGDVTRRVPLSLQFGWFVPRNQTFCAGQIPDGAPPPRLGKDELAAIAFGRPPDAGYLVRRGAAADFLVIDAWTQRSGGCVLGNREYNPCPRSQHVVALMHTPPRIKVEQRIIDVDDTGDHPFRCTR